MIKARGLSKTFRVHKKEAGLKGSLRALFAREWTTVHALKGANLDSFPARVFLEGPRWGILVHFAVVIAAVTAFVFWLFGKGVRAYSSASS
jgi:hypothetical protein